MEVPGVTATRYWLGVVSRAHILLGVEGGFIQLNHGKEAPLQRMREGDWIVIYSPKEELGSKARFCQGQTALGVGATPSGLGIWKFQRLTFGSSPAR